MAIIYIDRIPFEVKQGKNLLEACLSLGIDLPYFCWHPAMGSVGACRQCAVKVFKDEEDKAGRLVMSCMESVKDNLYLSVNDGTAKAFRKQIIEWLMTNHPHDCAVCDEGGSCHLQDMTVMTGHAYRRYEFKKRTYHNQYLGPFINHEMNRCIQCYRCVRFYKDYAGGKDLDVFAAHNHVYFGRSEDGILENEFSGNLVEVCPTGVFTDKTLKEHYTRKWDLTMAPSICQHCSLGCNIIAGERYGELRQITNRYNGEVNGYFICDRGRYGYEFVNSQNRIRQPLISDMIPQAVEKPVLLNYFKEVISGRMVGIGSPRASLESNFALRQLVGRENFYQGVTEETAEMMDLILSVYQSGDIHVASLKDAETADVVLVLGEDLTNSAPVLALSVRQAIRNQPIENSNKINIPEWHDAALRELTQQDKGDCMVIYPVSTKLDDVASQVHHLSPDDIARLGYAIAQILDPKAPADMAGDEVLLSNAESIAVILKNAKNPLIISGTSLFNASLIKAASNIATALSKEGRKCMLSFVVPECNSVGLAMMNAATFSKIPDSDDTTSDQTLIIIENDLCGSTTAAEAEVLFKQFSKTIVFDHLNNKTTARARVIIPVGTFGESDGTLVNNEGRAQCFFQVFKPDNEYIRESWRWLDELRQMKNGVTKIGSVTPEKLLRELSADLPQFKEVENVMPPADLRINQQKIAREPHRYSGRTAMHAGENVSEQKPPEDPDTPLSFTMEGYRGVPPAPLTPYFWAPGWNSSQSVHKYQTEPGGPLFGGNPGLRLFNADSKAASAYMNNIPNAFKPVAGEWLLMPLPHIFGSEPLSMYTHGVAERAPDLYIAIGRQDAGSLSADEGDRLQLKVDGKEFELKVILKDELRAGTAGLPYNLSVLSEIRWPAKGVLTNKSK